MVPDTIPTMALGASTIIGTLTPFKGALGSLRESLGCLEKARAGGYDGALGDREASAGTFREFVVYDEAQVYPEYVVIYRRDLE